MPRLSNAHSQLQVPNDKSHLGFNPEGQHAVHDLPKESVIEQVPPGQPIVLPLPSPPSNQAKASTLLSAISERSVSFCMLWFTP